jgi:hypothetical protein
MNKRKLLKIMCLDVLAFIGVTVIAIVLILIPLTALLWYIQLPYEWSHGYFFMTLKWFIAMLTTIGVVCFALGMLFEWIDNAIMRARK